jgi:hypothetical protein
MPSDVDRLLCSVRDLTRAMALDRAYELAGATCAACGMPAVRIGRSGYPTVSVAFLTPFDVRVCDRCSVTDQILRLAQHTVETEQELLVLSPPEVVPFPSVPSVYVRERRALYRPAPLDLIGCAVGISREELDRRLLYVAPELEELLKEQRRSYVGHKPSDRYVWAIWWNEDHHLVDLPNRRAVERLVRVARGEP